MTTSGRCRRGDVALLEVEFADRPGNKKLRPVVIVSGERYNSLGPDLLISTVTSNLSPVPHAGDHRIRHWEHAGLRHPSLAQTKLATTDAARSRREVYSADRGGSFAGRVSMRCATSV